ncbi:hypothetical protein BH10BAC3_BH10BAC3_14220 [soil metagenome]
MRTVSIKIQGSFNRHVRMFDSTAILFFQPTAIRKCFLFILIIFSAPFIAKAQSGIFESYAIISANGAANTYYDLNASTANTDFEGASLGTFFSGNTLVLNGAQNKVYKCNTDDITASTFFYRIYKTTDPAPAFTSSTIFFTSNDPGAGAGCQNQTWESAGAGINVLAGLTTPGNYYIEIYTTADYSFTSGGGGSGTHVANNSGANYKAQFTLSSDCVSGISVSPATQTVCRNTASTPITATITVAANSGAGAITYQWYSNTANSNSGGTLVKTTNTTTGTTADTYTPVTTASGTKYYYCVVTNLDGSCTTSTYSSLSSRVVVTSLPALNLTASPSGVICEGTNVTFTAVTVNAGTTPSFQWKLNGVNVGTNSNAYSSSTLAQGDVVSVVLTASTACTTPISKQLTMNVNDLLTPQVTIDATSEEICAGDLVTFTASPVNGGTTPSYQWKVNGLNIGTNSSTYTSSSLANGDIVSLDLTSNATCAAPTTVSSNSISLIVHPNLPVSVVITPSTNNICSGSAVTFTATPTNGGTAPVYQWKVNGINAGTNSATYTTSTLANNDVVTVELTSDVTPCATGNPATSNTVNMLVNPDLPVSVSIAASAASICPGNSVTFTATPINPGTTPSYQWKVNGINAGTNSSVFTTAALANSDAVSVVLTSDATPCATGNPATSNSIVIIVNPVLPVSVSVAASATTICSGASVTFTATAVNGGGSPSYQWKLNGVNTGTNSATFTTTTLSNTDVVAVVLTSNATPCASGSPATSNIVTMTVNARPSPTFTVSPAASICSATSVTYTTQAAHSNYTWSVPGVAGTDYTISAGGIGTGNNTVTLSWLTAGSKAVTVNYNNAAGCNGTSAASSNITVIQSVTPAVAVTASSTSICSASGTAVTFTATPTNGGSAPTYQWKRNGANIAGATSSTYTTNSLASPSTITVVLTSNAACATIATATSNSIVMTVYSGAPANIASNTIVGPTSICPPVSGLIYTVTPVLRAETYVWTLPPGFTITSGSGTSTITVSVASSATIANNQNVTVYATNPCGSGSSKTLNVNVNNFAGIDAGPDQSICAGGTVTLAGVWSGNTSSSNWTASSGSFSNAALITSTYTPSISSGNVTLTITTNDPAGTCPAVSDQMVVTVNQPPAISTQPITQTVCSGSNVTLNVAASGTGLTYQWRKSSTLLTDGGNISGANTATLTLTGVTSATAGSYSVIVTGTAPCTFVVSLSAVLTVNTAVAITTQPLATQNACAGSSASISVASTGTGRTFQWRKGTTPLTDGAAISGATTATITLNPVSSADAAADYNVVISGTAPCSPVTSSNAALVVYQPVSIVTNPVSQTICSGTPVSMSVGATGSGLTYQWKRNGLNISNGGTISGATTATLSISSAITGNAGSYTVLVSGTSPCTAVTSSAASLVVNQLVAISTQPTVTKTICSGSSTTFTVVASGTGLTYQWRRGTTILTDNGNVSGSNTATLTLNPVLVGDAASDYNVVVSGTSPCSPVTSNNSALVVNEAVNITTQPVSQAACIGNTVTLSVSATGLGLTYQWKKNGSNITNGGTIAGATTSTLTLTNVAASAAGNYTVLVTGTAPCTAVTSATAVLTVNQAVAITTQPSNASVCGTFAIDFNVVATGTGLSYQWYKSPGTPIANTANISGATTNNLHFTQGSTTDNGTYYVVVSGTSPCPAVTSLSKILDVNESISITTQPVAAQTICVGLSASFGVVATASDPLGYQWRKNGIDIAGATSSAYNIPVLAVADAGNYDVVISGPSGYTCPVSYTSVSSLTVTPTVGTPVFTAGAASTICQAAGTVTYAASASNSTSISYVLDGASLAAGNTILAATGAVTFAPGWTGTSIITATASGCNGPSTASHTVTVIPTVGIPSSISVAAGTEPGCQLVNGTTTTTFATAASNSTGFNWSLSNAAAGSINATTGLMTWANGFSGTVDIRVTANGCNGPSSQVIRTVVITPTVGSPTAITGTPPVCQLTSAGTTTTFTTTASNNTGFNWSISNAAAGTINAVTGVMTWANGFTGSVDLSVTANGCNGPSAQVVRSVNIGPTLSVPIFSLGVSSSRCFGTGTVTYTASATNSTGITYSLDAASISGGNSINSSTGAVSYISTWSGTSVVSASAAGCNGPIVSTHTITINPAPSGGTTIASSNLFVCAGSNAGTVSLTGQIGTVSKWQSSIDGGSNWTDISNTASSLSYTNLNQTTWYRAVIIQPLCPGLTAYSVHTVISVVPLSGAGSLTGIASPAVICSGSATLTASGTGSGGTVGVLSGGSFDQAGAPLEGTDLWRAYESGILHNISGSANNGVNPFNLTNGPKTFFGGTPGQVTYTNDPLDGQSNNNKFMVANGPVNSTLETPIFSLVGLTAASIDWYEAYILEAGASIKMEISTDGGNTYKYLRADVAGVATLGVPTNFIHSSVSLTAYAGLSNLRVRFTYTGTTYSSWALEMATITKSIAPATYTWNLYNPAPVTGTPPAHYLNVFTDTSVTVTPPTPNTTNAPIVYHYSLTSSGGGCASNINVTVNPTPVITHTTVSPACSGTALSPNITFSNTMGITTYAFAVTNPGGVTGLVTNTNGTISGTPVNSTATPQTVRFIASVTSPGCPGKPDTVSIVVNPTVTITISGNQTICGSGSNATLTLTSSGPFPFNVTLSNGITYTMNSSPFNITVNPLATTTYTIVSLSGACISNSGATGSAIVTVQGYTAGTTGTWLCAAGDGDWFNPCNWANGIIPDTSINVVIATVSSSCNPVINPLTSYAIANGPIAKSKNITISGTRNLSFANSGELQVAGNWLNNVGIAGFTANTGMVTMVGKVAQTISTVGATETFYNLRINNTSSVTQGVTLNSNVRVSNELTLLNGIVNTHSNPPGAILNAAVSYGLLTLTTTAKPVAGSPGINSFINGQLAKEFNTSGVASEYAYPIGKVISGVPVYKDMAVQPTTTSATTTFTSEYFPTAHPAPSVMLGTGLIGIVPEYWQVDQSGGTANAKIKIPYLNPGTNNWIGNNNAPTPDPCSACNVAVVRKDVSISGWNFTASAGNFSSTGPEFRFYQDNGYIYSAANSSFGPFTNGYAYNVILAVQLVTFEAKLVNGDGIINWTIADSKDLGAFELQHSPDGSSFTALASIAGKNGTKQYGYQHQSLSAGSHYYRLLVKEKSGKTFYSKTVLVMAGKDMTVIMGLQPTIVQSETFVKIHSVKSQTVHAELLDMAGRKMGIYKTNLVAGENKFSISVGLLAKGVYTLQVQTEDGIHANFRFMKD